jgi:hypothetical protein
MSEWQIAQAASRTRICPGPGGSSVTSSTVSGSLKARQTAASMRFIRSVASARTLQVAPAGYRHKSDTPPPQQTGAAPCGTAPERMHQLGMTPSIPST